MLMNSNIIHSELMKNDIPGFNNAYAYESNKENGT